MTSTVRERLLTCFMRVFPTAETNVLLTASMETFNEWDSLNAIRLFHEVEREFGIELDLDKLSEYTSFAMLERALSPHPLKGIIVDADNTLWHGLAGEGDNLIHHNIVQELLHALAHRGTLVAVASKNEVAPLVSALNSMGHGLSDKMFPVVASWAPKSQSVALILRTWNIDASDVLFVDDDPMELTEVKSAFPTIKTLLYHGGERRMCDTIKALCWKDTVTFEDERRIASIKQGLMFARAAENAGTATASQREDFFKKLNAVITFDYAATDMLRASELLAKANQFNMNGRKLIPIDDLGSRFLWTVRYRDRYGDMGIIAVIGGSCVTEPGVVHVDTWVMSCRAFSRRIEDACLHTIKSMHHADGIVLHAEKTTRNAPFFHMLERYGAEKTKRGYMLSRERIEERSPSLYHIRELA